MVDTRRFKHRPTVVTAAVLVGLFAAACGSSGGTTSAVSSAAPTGVPTSGPGLTEPTHPSGARQSGGTVTFTEGSQLPPNYIFPVYTFSVCSTANSNQFMYMMYRPLYWFGNNYSPTINYNYSIGQAPVFSNGGKTVTIKLNAWKYSNGEPITARDLVFWMNVIKADPATEWCGYAPGYFPDNVSSYSAPNSSTFVMNFNKTYNQEWILYSELSQLTPMPLTWDRTSFSGCSTHTTPQTCPVPSNTSNLPDTTKSGAAAVYKFLDGQAKQLGSWTTSPLWSTVDGPFKLQSYNTDGAATLVANTTYSGTPKPTISKLQLLPFTSEAAIYNETRSGGPSAVTIASIPSQYAPQLSTLAGLGYDVNKAASYSFNYFPLNLNSNASTSPGGEPVRYVLRQAYFRQAFQHLVDQPGWISAFLYHTADPTCGPIPPAPSTPLVDTTAVSSSTCAFSVSAAQSLLTANGWKVVSGGTTTCIKPGTATGDCGAGIKSGEGIAFNVDYESGVVAVQNEMNDLEANAKKVGVTVNLTTHPFNTVIATGVPCAPSASTCKWTGENWGAGWIYGPSYLPTGEQLYNPGSAANSGSYGDAKMTQLIGATITGPNSVESHAIATYAQYVAQQLPVVFGPTSVGTYGGYAATLVDKKLGGYAANALGLMNPEDWYFTK
jgi:peptide/nickel transport system substrate-binding protein